MRLEVEKSNYQSQIVQLKEIIEANKNEIAKSYDLFESKKAENEQLYHDVLA